MAISEKIEKLADQYAYRLAKVNDARVSEMQGDDVSHPLIYRVLGISEQEGSLIYQNKGRFLYKYAGSFFEEATKLCFKDAFTHSATLRIPNTRGERPKTFDRESLKKMLLKDRIN